MSDLPFSTPTWTHSPHDVIHPICTTTCGPSAQYEMCAARYTDVRYPLGPSWHLRRCDAEASTAGEIRTHATRCMEYAALLEEIDRRHSPHVPQNAASNTTEQR
jgi:hypothetical protein